ncbi:hypothetical protein Tco_1032982 [Tanacetum coccineum]|uniref:Uncharacterized protein n=1 Tax=Tanacetum coccineum TaxID=301880 RepID=A0ABQ5GDG3_9ASTR
MKGGLKWSANAILLGGQILDEFWTLCINEFLKGICKRLMALREIVREVFGKLLLDSFGKQSIRCKKIKKCKRGNRKIRIPIALWLCRVEEKMTLKEVDGQTVEEIETNIIAKDGTITRVLGKFQGYETSEEEPVEQPRRHDLYGFLIEDEEEVERNEVDSDLKSIASSKPVWKKTTKADHDRASCNCPYCSN